MAIYFSFLDVTPKLALLDHVYKDLRSCLSSQPLKKSMINSSCQQSKKKNLLLCDLSSRLLEKKWPQ